MKKHGTWGCCWEQAQPVLTKSQARTTKIDLLNLILEMYYLIYLRLFWTIYSLVHIIYSRF